jgi:hypothetical protein
LKFNRSFEKHGQGGRAMQRTIAPGIGSGEAPLLVRLGGKFVLEVLPAALASAIGAFLFAQYQFDRSALAGQAVTPAVAAPASAEMLQIVREEHAMIRAFLTAQQAAEQNRAAAADVADAQAADAQATADARPTIAVQRPDLPSGVMAAAPRSRIIVAGAPDGAAAALPPIAIAAARPAAAAPVTVASAHPDATAPVVAPTSVSATARPNASLWPAPPPPAHPSIVAGTLAVPGHVISVTLHAVMAIGGIPSWLGHRFGDEDVGAAALPSSSAS